jgi:UDP-N-acetyl-2-amino-2-deoxyglucuronate dehydrogenase
LRRASDQERVQVVTICSPNYLHDAHCRLAMRVGADVICEKPLVVNPWNLDSLQEIESETGRKVNTILQLRVHPELLKLKARLDQESSDVQHDVMLSYVTSRGSWYHVSWKGQIEKSGGVATNIGIHFFDLLIWLFGPAGDTKVYHSDKERMSGFIELERARVRWFLSVDHNDLPETAKHANKTTFRSITVDDQEVEFSEGFTDLHTRVYERTLAGDGFGIADACPSIELTHRIRQAEISPADSLAHPFLKAK